MREQRVILKHDADIAFVRRRARDIDPGDRDMALVGRGEPRDEAQQSRLAAA